MESIGSGVISDFHLGLMHIKSNRFTSSKLQVIFCTCFCAPFCPPSTVSCIQHAISVSELPGLLQTTNSTLVLYSFDLCSVSFFMLLIIPFMQSLFQNYLVCYRQPIPHWLFIHLLYAVFFFCAINYPFHCPPYRQLSYC